MNSWGFQASLVPTFKERKVNYICVYDRDVDRLYQISFDKFLDVAFPGNYGDGDQLFVRLNDFDSMKIDALNLGMYISSL